MPRRLAAGCLILLAVVVVAVPCAVYLWIRPELVQVERDIARSREARYPPTVRLAVVAVEDRDFFRQSSAVHSSLIQQVVKWHLHGRNISRHVKGVLIALAVDRTVPRDAILNAYLDQVYLGQDGTKPIYGVRDAARFYFGVAPEDLTIAQTASLVAAIRNPKYFAPAKMTESTIERRLQVLSAMRRASVITVAESEEAARLTRSAF